MIPTKLYCENVKGPQNNKAQDEVILLFVFNAGN